MEIKFSLNQMQLILDAMMTFRISKDFYYLSVSDRWVIQEEIKRFTVLIEQNTEVKHD